MKPIFLTGVKHSGKTTLGKLLAEILRVDFIDIDDVITKQNGMTPRDIFLKNGECGFQEAELKACREICAALVKENRMAVIAAGGGLCDNILAVDCVRNTGHFVYIDVSEQIVLKRILDNAVREPDGTLKNLPAYLKNARSEKEAAELFHPIYTKRSEQYTLFAGAVFAPENISAEQNAQKLAEIISRESRQEFL